MALGSALFWEEGWRGFGCSGSLVFRVLIAILTSCFAIHGQVGPIALSFSL